MKGLLRKDFYVLTRERWYQLVALVVFAVLPVFPSATATVFAALIPYMAMYCDDECRWPELAAMMPYSPVDTVLSKYLLGWGSIGIATLLCFFSRWIFSSFLPEYGGVHEVIFAALTALSVFAVIMPLLFRFGAGEGRGGLVFLLSLIALGSIAYLYLAIDNDIPGSAYAAVLTLLPYATAVMTAVSVPMSLQICRDHPIPEP